MDRTLDLIAPLVRGRRVIGEDFVAPELEDRGRRVNALRIALAFVEIDDGLHRVSHRIRDRRPRLCPANRPNRAERARRRIRRKRAPRLSRRAQGGLY